MDIHTDDICVRKCITHSCFYGLDVHVNEMNICQISNSYHMPTYFMYGNVIPYLRIGRNISLIHLGNLETYLIR